MGYIELQTPGVSPQTVRTAEDEVKLFRQLRVMKSGDEACG